MFEILNAINEGIKAAFKSIKAHGIRSTLTTLGIIIGVMSVIAVVIIMEALSANISKNLNDLGSDMVTLKAYTSIEDQMVGMQNKLTYEDFQLLKRKVNGIENITPVMQPMSLNARISYGRNSVQTQIIGTESGYKKLIKIFPQTGRFFNENDDLRRKRVVFIGHTVAEKLHMPKNPVGEYINLGGDWFHVIGLAEGKGDIFGFDQDNFVMAPFSTIKSLNGSKATDNIFIRFNLVQGYNLDKIKLQIINILKHKYKQENSDKDHYEFITAKKMRENFEGITNVVTLVAGGIVAISLLVGGIGIMNIMLVSVTERTPEIGIQKALGATPQFIMLQFLIESLALSLLGGLIGIALGYVAALFLSLLIPSIGDVGIPVWAIWLSISFTTSIGLIFGIAPAMKAARLNPIDALRYNA